MGWIKTPIKASKDIFNDIIKKCPTWKETYCGGSAYEYWADHIRDYYDVTLKQCDEICTMLREYYQIKKFYATDK